MKVKYEVHVQIAPDVPNDIIAAMFQYLGDEATAMVNGGPENEPDDYQYPTWHVTIGEPENLTGIHLRHIATQTILDPIAYGTNNEDYSTNYYRHDGEVMDGEGYDMTKYEYHFEDRS